MIFFFDGQERWRGLWETPNQAAAVLAVAAIFFVTLLTCALSKREMNQRWWLIVLLSAVLASALWLLVNTYSRGGWAGFIVGIVWLIAAMRKQCLVPAAALIVFGLLICATPAAGRRAVTSSEWNEDLSIANRLIVWKGALAMFGDHPGQGVGPGRFGHEFRNWYQPPAMRTDYRTAVNDYLTVAAERGVPGLVLLFGTAAWLLWPRASVPQRWLSKLATGSSSSFAALLTSGVFSSLLFKSDVAVPVFLACGTVLLLAEISPWLGGKQIRTWLRPSVRLAGSLGMGVVATLALFIMGKSAADRHPTRARPLAATEMRSVWEVAPRHGQVRGTLVYFGSRAEGVDDLGRDTLRPLASEGWHVVCAHQPRISLDALGAGRELLDFLKRSSNIRGSLRLAGHRQGGQIALALAGEAHATFTAALGVVAHSAFAETSPSLHLQTLAIPAVLAHFREDATVPPAHLLMAEAHLPAQGRSHLLPGAFDPEGRNWRLWLSLVAGPEPPSD